MTAKYSQMVEQRGIRATVTIEITPDAYQQFDAQAVRLAAYELKSGDRSLVIDTSRNPFDDKRYAEFPSVIDAVKQSAEAAGKSARKAITGIVDFIVTEQNKIIGQRKTEENEREAKVQALGQTAADLAAQNVRIADEKLALEKALARANRISETHAGAAKRLAEKNTALEERLKKQQLSKPAKKSPIARTKQATPSKATSKKA